MELQYHNGADPLEQAVSAISSSIEATVLSFKTKSMPGLFIYLNIFVCEHFL